MREGVSKEVREALTKRAKEFNIKLDDVAITDLKFGKEFTAAIESKQVAQQDAERSKFIVLKAEQERRAAIIRAEGESEAAKLVSEALQDSPALVELRRIDAELEGTPLVTRGAEPAELFEQVEAQFRARRRAHLDQLETARARQEAAEAKQDALSLFP